MVNNVLWYALRFKPAKHILMETNTFLNQKIFIVDDDLMTAGLYEQALFNLGYSQVSVFGDAQSALNELTSEPRIIFLDQNMDNMSGLTALRKIKRFDPNLYVIFISGQDDVATAVTSLKYGAFDYIVKGEGEIERIEEVLVKVHKVQEMLSKKGNPFIRKILSVMV
jgi:DNA-binding NtrC family response regulator